MLSQHCADCDAMTFEAEAAMRLEACCGDPLQVAPYSWTVENGLIDLRECIRRICDARTGGEDVGAIATRFHSTVLAVIVGVCRMIRDDGGGNKVVLSGGCFQNRCIFEGAVQQLQDNNFFVYTHTHVPCNDGGVALGQLIVAAERKNV